MCSCLVALEDEHQGIVPQSSGAVSLAVAANVAHQQLQAATLLNKARRLASPVGPSKQAPYGAFTPECGLGANVAKELGTGPEALGNVNATNQLKSVARSATWPPANSADSVDSAHGQYALRCVTLESSERFSALAAWGMGILQFARSEKGPASPPRALPSDAYDVATARAPRGAPPVARTVRVISMESAGLGARGAKDLSESRSSEEEP
eukprot:g16168.t1